MGSAPPENRNESKGLQMSNITSKSYPVVTDSKAGDQFAIVRNGQLQKVTREPVAEYAKDKAVSALRIGGTTANRPDSADTFTIYFDTDLGKPLWYDGLNWVDATGTVV